MQTERILITVKTYPTLSKKYVETVCTAGITDGGQWRRLYPIRFRYLDHEKQYRVYDIVEVVVESVSKDGRAESRSPRSDTLKRVGNIKSWPQRDMWVRPTIFASMSEMLGQGRTIGPVAAQRVIDLEATPTDADWSPAQKQQMNQQGLWATDDPLPLEKIPMAFYLIWEDGEGAQHKHMFISWEICQTWRSFRDRYGDPMPMLKEKWLGDLLGPGRDIAFFMGNSAQFRENYMVCGTYTPPKGVADEQRLF